MHARWLENTPPPAQQYTITFDTHGGSEVTAITANAGTGVEQPGNPTKTDSAFLGWFSAAAGGTLYTWPHTLNANITMHAQWLENSLPPAQQYIITFDSHGGSEVRSITQDEGTAVERPADPTWNGYDFEGWHSAITGGTKYDWPHVLTANVTMHAQWTAIPYSISYELNGGTNATENPATYTVENLPITLAAPSRVGYTFAGWHSDAGFTTPAPGIPAGSTGDKTFYAQWTVIPYAISYELNGGTNVTENPATYIVESLPITLAAPSRVDYTFAGWHSDAGFATPVTGIPAGSTGDKTFYALWTATPYTITYNLNGGTNNSANPPSYTVESPAITLADPSRANYTFGGWHDDAGLVIATTGIPAGSTGNKTFYAKWNPGATVQITLQPQPVDPTLANVSIFVDEEVQFSAAGAGYVSWQWRWNGTPIGANSAIYTLAANSQPAGVHELSVEVSVNGEQTLLARCRVTLKAK
jgi:uncharacterized repeat protein (TIGR02543 family)